MFKPYELNECLTRYCEEELARSILNDDAYNNDVDFLESVFFATSELPISPEIRATNIKRTTDVLTTKEDEETRTQFREALEQNKILAYAPLPKNRSEFEESLALANILGASHRSLNSSNDVGSAVFKRGANNGLPVSELIWGILCLCDSPNETLESSQVSAFVRDVLRNDALKLYEGRRQSEVVVSQSNVTFHLVGADRSAVAYVDAFETNDSDGDAGLVSIAAYCPRAALLRAAVSDKADSTTLWLDLLSVNLTNCAFTADSIPTKELTALLNQKSDSPLVRFKQTTLRLFSLSAKDDFQSYLRDLKDVFVRDKFADAGAAVFLFCLLLRQFDMKSYESFLGPALKEGDPLAMALTTNTLCFKDLDKIKQRIEASFLFQKAPEVPLSKLFSPDEYLTRIISAFEQARSDTIPAQRLALRLDVALFPEKYQLVYAKALEQALSKTNVFKFLGLGYATLAQIRFRLGDRKAGTTALMRGAVYGDQKCVRLLNQLKGKKS